MKKIKLSQGKCALVDNKDYEWLNQYKWCVGECNGHYYAMRKYKNTSQRMHRFIMGLTPDDGKETDHINRDGLDNRRTNLRIVTHLQNSHNSCAKKHRENATSQYKGVSKKRDKWRVRCMIEGIGYHIGTFQTEWEAAVAYNNFASSFMGEYAHLNSI